jgi:hypothetical protein
MLLGDTKMKEHDILLAVLDYHCRVNLSKLMDDIKNGRYIDPDWPDEPIELHKYENGRIKSCSVIIDGREFAGQYEQKQRELKIEEKRVLKAGDIEYQDVSTIEELKDYFIRNKHEDGYRILENSAEGSRIGELGIISHEFAEGVVLEDIFPKDHIYEPGKTVNGIPRYRKMGGKTKAGAAISTKFRDIPVHVCFIKQTAVNETATGSIVYLGPNGLEEEIIFRYAPELKDQTYKVDGHEHKYAYLDDSTSIIGVHRKYTKLDGNFVLLHEQYIGKSGDSFVFQPVAHEYSSIEDSLTSPLPQSGETPNGYRFGIEGLISAPKGIEQKKVEEKCCSN